MTETTSIRLTPTRSEVERAVSFGVRAPSIHNTQPWRWVYRPGVLELYADRSRQLPALDPDGRALVDLVDERPVYIVLFSTADDRVARLRAGEAYARISVEAERIGLASSAMTQAVDLPAVRERFRALMNWPDHPQMVLRVGYPQPGPTPPPTGRRALTAVLSFED